LLFYQLLEHNVQGIFRLQEGGTNEEIFSFWQSADEDKIIEYNPSNTVKHDLKKQGYNLDFKTLKMRLKNPSPKQNQNLKSQSAG
jgi:hypothetical protein